MLSHTIVLLKLDYKFVSIIWCVYVHMSFPNCTQFFSKNVDFLKIKNWYTIIIFKSRNNNDFSSCRDVVRNRQLCA